jgi:uncharacterized protein (UPF0548 family)
LAHLLNRTRNLPLSYDQVGVALAAAPSGLRVGEVRVVLGRGETVYARAVRALQQWQQFDLGWARIYPENAPLEPGTNVLVVTRHFGFWSVNACRIVYGLSEHTRVVPSERGRLPEAGSSVTGGPSIKIAGFAYGTLTHHAESGEEIFQVSWDPVGGEVVYQIRAVSRERALLAHLGFPLARALQARFRRDSAKAMQRFVSDA